MKRFFLTPVVRWRLTWLGYGYCLVAAAVFLLAVNFSNNLLFTYSFFLIAIMLVNVFMATVNIKGIKTKMLHVNHGYQGDEYGYALLLHNEDKSSLQISLNKQGFDDAKRSFNLQRAQQLNYQHKLPAIERGAIAEHSLRVYSRWPLGLIEVSKQACMLPQALVYPKPKMLADAPVLNLSNSELVKTDPEILEGVREYRNTDSPRRIHWQAFAKTETLQVKDFSGGEGDVAKLLYWDQLSQLSTEERLSCLCYWLLFYQRQGALIGLQLPGQLIMPKTAMQLSKTLQREATKELGRELGNEMGGDQLQQCLAALALMPRERISNV